MKLIKNSVAGTLESSDIHVMVEPSNTGISLVVNSTVLKQYGQQIKDTIHEVLNNLDVKDAKIVVQDQGALDCTIKARVQTALFRASDTFENLPWGTKL